MEHETAEQARARAASYTATRLVWARLGRGPERGEWVKALDDYWTGQEDEDVERGALLLEALADYGAFLARKAATSDEEARDDALLQVWALLPEGDAARGLDRSADW